MFLLNDRVVSSELTSAYDLRHQLGHKPITAASPGRTWSMIILRTRSDAARGRGRGRGLSTALRHRAEMSERPVSLPREGECFVTGSGNSTLYKAWHTVRFPSPIGRFQRPRAAGWSLGQVREHLSLRCRSARPAEPSRGAFQVRATEEEIGRRFAFASATLTRPRSRRGP